MPIIEENEMRRTFERSVFIPDIHVPFHDPAAIETTLAFLRFYKPQVVFQLGDFLDLYSLSKFDRNPARAMCLADDIKQGYALLKRIRAAVPDAKMFLLRGNHEYRLTKYLWTKAAELSGLHGLKIQELLRLSSLNIYYVEDGVMMFHGFIVKHGNVVRVRAGYSATGELDKAGMSGVSGHTHRMAQVYRRDFQGRMFTWIESGCLTSLRPEYLEGQTVDWCHGLTYGVYEKRAHNSRFMLHPTPIINAKIIFQGKEIHA